MNRLKVLLLLPVMFSAAGCEVLYDAQQDRTDEQCRRLTQLEERSACLKRNQASYDQYERDREKLRRGASEKSDPFKGK